LTNRSTRELCAPSIRGSDALNNDAHSYLANCRFT
jgi:hypothetical protein